MHTDARRRLLAGVGVLGYAGQYLRCVLFTFLAHPVLN
jgi:hypothetical protein